MRKTIDIQFEDNLPIPKCRQIIDAIKQKIQAGDLKKGDKIPSLNQLCLNKAANGLVKVKLLNASGQTATEQNFQVKLESFLRTDIPVSMILPAETGGYLLVAEFTPENGQPVFSRRFLKVGQAEKYNYFNLNPVKK